MRLLLLQLQPRLDDVDVDVDVDVEDDDDDHEEQTLKTKTNQCICFSLLMSKRSTNDEQSKSNIARLTAALCSSTIQLFKYCQTESKYLKQILSTVQLLLLSVDVQKKDQ